MRDETESGNESPDGEDCEAVFVEPDQAIQVCHPADAHEKSGDHQTVDGDKSRLRRQGLSSCR